MRVAIAGTGKETTQLGYGCASLMGRISRRDSRRILDAAFDSGIRHFDTAPLYGYGESEKLLGEFIKGRRDRVTVATKFGIRPPKRSVALSTAKSTARAVVAVFPQLRRHIRRRAEQMTQAGCFTAEECTRSLHNSLRELGTDHIDMFLMHEIVPEQITPELLATLQNARQQGLIREYGTATTYPHTVAIRSLQLPAGKIAQFPNSAFENVLEQFPQEDGVAIVSHSSLGTGFKRLKEELASDSELRRNWSRTLGFDCSDVSGLGALFLQIAMTDNASGMVLFSSVNEQNIRRNAALLGSEKFSDEQLLSAKQLTRDFLERNPLFEVGLAAQ